MGEYPSSNETKLVVFILSLRFAMSGGPLESPIAIFGDEQEADEYEPFPPLIDCLWLPPFTEPDKINIISDAKKEKNMEKVESSSKEEEEEEEQKRLEKKMGEEKKVVGGEKKRQVKEMLSGEDKRRENRRENRLKKKALSARESRKRKKSYLLDLERKTEQLSERVRELEAAQLKKSKNEKEKDAATQPQKSKNEKQNQKEDLGTKIEKANYDDLEKLKIEKEMAEIESAILSTKGSPSAELVTRYKALRKQRKMFISGYLSRLGDLLIPEITTRTVKWALEQADQYASRTGVNENLFASLIGEAGPAMARHLTDLCATILSLGSAQNTLSANLKQIQYLINK